MYFKVGVTCAVAAPAGVPFPLVNPDIYRTVDFLAENGFDSIELHLLKPSEVDAGKIKEYCAEKKIMISSIGTGIAVYKRQILTRIRRKRRSFWPKPVIRTALKPRSMRPLPVINM